MKNSIPNSVSILQEFLKGPCCWLQNPPKGIVPHFQGPFAAGSSQGGIRAQGMYLGSLGRGLAPLWEQCRMSRGAVCVPGRFPVPSLVPRCQFPRNSPSQPHPAALLCPWAFGNQELGFVAVSDLHLAQFFPPLCLEIFQAKIKAHRQLHSATCS